MEDIIDQLNDITLISSILEGTDKRNFEKDIMKQLNNIQASIDEIYQKIFECKLSKNKYNKLFIDNKKETIVIKLLFPYYWTINEVIDLQKKCE